MLKIHISFWIAAIIFWLIGQGLNFLMVAIAVTAHELAHMVCAKFFGCKIRQMHISALGEMSILHKLEGLRAFQRTAILVAGPMCNLIMGLIARHFAFETFAFYNFILCGFNLLPIFPLDGAKLLQLFAGNRIGVMPANRLILKLGFGCCMALIALGVVQAILFAPNITMLCAGFVLWRRNRGLQVELTGEFYIALLNKKPPLPIKFIYAEKNQPIAAVVDAMGWDNILMLCVDDKIIGEKQIVDYVVHKGLGDTIEDCVRFTAPSVYLKNLPL